MVAKALTIVAAGRAFPSDALITKNVIGALSTVRSPTVST